MYLGYLKMLLIWHWQIIMLQQLLFLSYLTTKNDNSNQQKYKL